MAYWHLSVLTFMYFIGLSVLRLLLSDSERPRSFSMKIKDA